MINNILTLRTCRERLQIIRALDTRQIADEVELRSTLLALVYLYLYPTTFYQIASE